MQRPAQKRHIAAYRSSTCKARYRLIYDRLKNRSRNIFLGCPLIDQRLNICFCKYTAACRNRIKRLIALGKLIQSHRVRIEQGRHLVNKSTCAACARSIHSLLKRRLHISNFSVFSAQLQYNICLRNIFLRRPCPGNDLLDKRQS